MISSDEEGSAPHRASRRAVLGGGVAAIGGLAGSALIATEPTWSAPSSVSGQLTYPFRGTWQAGITTPVQERMFFASFDVRAQRKDGVVALLKRWTRAAERLTAGLTATPSGAFTDGFDRSPGDTGEAIGLPASGLTLTFGFGPTFFQSGDQERFGLGSRKPRALRELPPFEGDQLLAARSGGDLCIQACANDPQVAFHAVRALAKIGGDAVRLRWSQEGFGRTAITSHATTPRNLFGFKDGTANIQASEHEALRRHVWVAPSDDPASAWLAGGSYLVARRTEMDIEGWDGQSLAEQEAQVGRTKQTGAPLSGGGEFTKPNFEGPDSTSPMIPLSSHLRVMHPDFNHGRRMLRRGYSFAEGSDISGRFLAGLFFIAFVRNPNTHFIPFQRAMARNDASAQWFTVTGSSVFACPPGIGRGEFIGERLFA